jgi:hypothetical protein
MGRLSKTCITLALTAFTFAGGSQAQSTGAIHGRIIDAITRDPVPDVIVTIMGSALSTGTDADGNYRIDSIMPGLVKIEAQLLGYLPITTDYYTIKPDSSVTVDFMLAPMLYELERVEVTGQSPQRKWVPHQGAMVLTKEQLPQRGNILNALQGVVPGVRVTGRREDTRMIVRGSSNDVLYVIDGRVIRPPLTFYIDAANVECVEVRRGFSAVAEFKPSIVGANYAGVILIWTRGALGPRPRQCLPGE